MSSDLPSQLLRRSIILDAGHCEFPISLCFALIYRLAWQRLAVSALHSEDASLAPSFSLLGHVLPALPVRNGLAHRNDHRARRGRVP